MGIWVLYAYIYIYATGHGYIRRGWKFLVTEIFFSAKTSSWGPKTQKKKLFGGGGGRQKNKNFPTKFCFQKCSWGSETACNFFFFFGGGDFGVFGAPQAPTRGSRGVGKRYTSSYDHDMWPVKILERSGLAVKSYHPETLAAEEEKNKKLKQN